CPCHLRVRRLPSIYTLLPFFRYSPAISASLLKNTTRCHSVRSCICPLCLSFQLSDVARVTLVTAPPLGIKRVSGSLPRLPIRMTLLTPRAMCLLHCQSSSGGYCGRFIPPAHGCPTTH